MVVERTFWRFHPAKGEKPLLNTDTGAAIWRRRLRTILIPAISAAVAGFLISYVFPASYVSQSLVRVVIQKVPNFTLPNASATLEYLAEPLGVLEQQVLAQRSVAAMLQHVDGTDIAENLDRRIDRVRQNMMVEPVFLDQSGNPTVNNALVRDWQTGFYIKYVDSSASRAQRICMELTAMMLEESVKTRGSQSENTVSFLTRQIDLAYGNLKKLDAQIRTCRNRRAPQTREAEAKCKKLMGDRKRAQDLYKQLVEKRNQSELAMQLENASTDYQLRVLRPASLPESPDFPNRLLFAFVGMGTGLVLGTILALRIT